MRLASAALLSLTLVPAAADAARANDGWGGLASTGLQFEKSDAIEMLSERLFLSPQKIRVAYEFRNRSPQDVTGTVVFPLPPINVVEDDFRRSAEAMDRANPVAFRCTVDGQAIGVAEERRAVLEELTRGPALFDNPGRDVTGILHELSIPLTTDAEKLTQLLVRLPLPTRERLEAEGLVFAAADPTPQWSIAIRYHWTQTFPAGRRVRVEHSYDALPPGGIFYWSGDDAEYVQDLRRAYCIDPPTERALARMSRTGCGDGETGCESGVRLDLAYILTTARTWKGPIGRFDLTIDKGHPDNVLSLCLDGLRKTGPTTFRFEARDYVPDRDLRLLFVTTLERLEP